MYIYAVQVNPEHKETPFDIMRYTENEFDGIIIDGNKNYCSIKTPLYEDIEEAIEKNNELYNLVDTIEEEKTVDEQIEAAKYFFPGYNLSYDQLDMIYRAFKNFNEANGYYTDDLKKDLLTALSGKQYVIKTIRGCCQSDYNFLYYPMDEYPEETINNIEIEYFNTGEEYSLYYSEKENLTIEQVKALHDPDYFYGHCYKNTDQIKEISEYTGTDISNITLFTISGHKTIETYTTFMMEG